MSDPVAAYAPHRHTPPELVVEEQLVDVVIRHELARLPLDPNDFSLPACEQYWAAITAIWQRDSAPSIERVHRQLLADGVHHTRRDAADLLFLAQGYRRHVDDYIALVLGRSRSRHVAMVLSDAVHSIQRGADPDAVLRRVQEQVA